MDDGIYTALSGAMAQQKRLNAVSQNLANVNTTGYRERDVSFEEIVATEDGVSRQTDIDEVASDQSAGNLKKTDNPLDLAINGNGFFRVGRQTDQSAETETDDGGSKTSGSEEEELLITRDGNLKARDDGTLVTQQGNPVLNKGGDPIRIPPESKNIEVRQDGSIHDQLGFIDQIAMVGVDDPTALEAHGDTNFETTTANLDTDPDAVLKQGFLEGSNVDPTQNMTEMIKIQRHFDTMTKMIQTYDQIDSRAINNLNG